LIGVEKLNEVTFPEEEMLGDDRVVLVDEEYVFV
jgi:hypothetical protein